MDASQFLAHVLSISYGIGVSLASAGCLYTAGLAILPTRSEAARSELPALLGAAIFLCVCWFGVPEGVPLSTLAAWFAGAALIVGLVRFRWMATSARSVLTRTTAGWALIFALLYVLAYLFTMPPATKEYLPPAWTGNIDLLTYIRHARYLLDPHAWNRWMYLNHVYGLTPGVFHLLGALSLFYDQDPIQAAMPAQFAFTALVGLFAARISRTVFTVSRGAALAIGAILVSGAFFRYLAAAYFLSTLMALPVLMFLLWSTVSHPFRKLLDVDAWLRFGSAYVLLLLLYPYLLIVGIGMQVVAAGLLFVAETQSRSETGGSLKMAAGRAGRTLGAMVVPLSLLVYGFYDQVLWLRRQAAQLTEKDVAGWPMDLIRPETIVGLPGGAITEVGVQIASGQLARALAVFSVMALWLFALYFRGSRANTPPAARALAGLAGVAIVAYGAFYFTIGPSYQQWKFASYTVPPWSFVLFAGTLQLVHRSALFDRAARAAGGRLAATALLGAIAVGLVGGNLWYRTVRDRELLRFPGALRDIAQIDALESFRTVSLWSETPGDLTAWFAVYFLPSKSVRVVSDGSVFDVTLTGRISDVQPLLILGECPNHWHDETVSIAGAGCLLLAPPTPQLGTTYSFGHRNAFLSAEGLDSREPGTRWNRERLVQLKIAADPRRMGVGRELYVNLHVQPFLPPGLRSLQRMVMSWGSGRYAETSLDGANGLTEWISLPVRSGDWTGNWVWLLPISIELPDAIGGVLVGPPGSQHREDRALAVMFIDLSISAEPEGRLISPAASQVFNAQQGQVHSSGSEAP